MSTQISSQRNRCTCCLGDPHYTAMRLIATVAEFACLWEEEFCFQLFLTAFCSQWHYHRIMHLKEYFCQWLGALLVVRPVIFKYCTSDKCSIPSPLTLALWWPLHCRCYGCGGHGTSKPTASHRHSTGSINPILSDEEGNELWRSTAIALCGQEVISPGNVKVKIHMATTNQKQAVHGAGTKREHHEIMQKARQYGIRRYRLQHQWRKVMMLVGLWRMVVLLASNNKQMTVERTLYHIMHDAKIDCVKDLADAFPINEKCKTINWNWPRTQQPFAAKFCV